MATEEKQKENSEEEANATRPRRLRKNVSRPSKPAQIVQSEDESASVQGESYNDSSYDVSAKAKNKKSEKKKPSRNRLLTRKKRQE